MNVQWGEPSWFSTPPRYLRSRTTALKGVHSGYKREKSNLPITLSMSWNTCRWSVIEISDGVTRTQVIVYLVVNMCSTVENKVSCEMWQSLNKFTEKLYIRYNVCLSNGVFIFFFLNFDKVWLLISVNWMSIEFERVWM